jgi:hypothetical protein
MPHLDGIDAMPARVPGRALEEVIYRGASGAIGASRRGDVVGVAESFGEVASFDVRDKVELGDDFLGGSFVDGFGFGVFRRPGGRGGGYAEGGCCECAQQEGGELVEHDDATPQK